MIIASQTANLGRAPPGTNAHRRCAVQEHNEVWRDVAGYQGKYQVSSLGRVRSFARARPRILSQATHVRGYKKVNLYQAGTRITYLVHVLVLEGFTGPRPESHEVNHKDGNTRNNQL